MAKINVAGLQDVKAEELLKNSRYVVECTSQKVLDKTDGNKTLALSYRIKAGITQDDGGSPEDRRLSDFFPLSGYERMKDGGEFCKRKLREAADAFGVEIDDEGNFDPEDFLLQTADVLTRNKENKDLGIMETSVNKYVKTA